MTSLLLVLAVWVALSGLVAVAFSALFTGARLVEQRRRPAVAPVPAGALPAPRAELPLQRAHVLS